MRIGFIIFDKMTLLDFIGFYDPITRLKTMRFINDLEWDICSFTEDVKDMTGIRIEPQKIRQSLSQYDMIFIPGGFGTRSLMNDKDFIEWIKTAKHCNLKTSVCTGSLIFGAAGFLENKTATTHPTAFEDLKKYCIVKDKRIIDEGDIVTARGVSSSIDLGLYICEKLCGEQIRKKIQIQMDYGGCDLWEIM